MTAEREPVTELPRNTVVAYQGGGYDGCFWEWNYAFIDKDGNFHDIFSSGYKGIKDAEGLLEALNEDKEIDTYDMGDEEERQRMCDSESVRNSLGIANWFAAHPELEVKVTLKCDRCGERVEPEGCQADGFHGCGGIEIAADRIICPECYSMYSCWYCGEYTSGELTGEVTKEDGTTIELHGDACEWCAGDIKDGRREV